MANRDTDMQSRRTEHRRRALKQAKAILSDWTMLDCLLRDLTDEGARLEFAAPVELPATFRVQFVSDNSRRAAELMWQRGQSAGVRFVAKPSEEQA
jgi:hypothetical protein